MTYIFDMASGTEYQGEDTLRPQPTTAPGSAAPTGRDDTHCQVELRLAQVETESFAKRESIVPAGMDLRALIDALD